MRKLKIKKWELSILLGMIIAVVISGFSAFAGECAQIRQNVLRLHVLANSDSEEDQALKLKVRDAVLTASGELFYQAQSEQDAKQQAQSRIEELQAAAQAAVIENGYDYPVKVTVTNMFFETRQYQTVTMPAGRYDAVRVEIGAAEGHNWWCVMFPPMCLPAAGEKQELEKVLNDEQLDIVETKPKYEAKFAILELFSKIEEAFNKE